MKLSRIIAAVLLSASVALTTSGCGPVDWFGNASPTAAPSCDVTAPGEPVPAPVDTRIPPPAPGMKLAEFEVSIQTLDLDVDGFSCGTQARVPWDIHLYATVDGANVFTVLQAGHPLSLPYDARISSPYALKLWLYYGADEGVFLSAHGVEIDFIAKHAFADALGGQPLPANGVGAGCLVKLDGATYATDIRPRMVEGDTLHCHATIGVF